LQLARSAAHLEREVSPNTLPGASPINRVAARGELPLFQLLAERLADLERPVTTRGMAAVEELLSSDASPLFARERADRLGPDLLRCLVALEPERKRD
jgi:hypothetical protein